MASYLDTGKVSIKKFHVPVEEIISDGFAEALALYDQVEEVSGLSQASLIKNRRPIRYLLEYMTSLGYQKLSDIKPGDTNKAIRDMLDKHYEPTSLITAISAMRRSVCFLLKQRYAVSISVTSGSEILTGSTMSSISSNQKHRDR